MKMLATSIVLLSVLWAPKLWAQEYEFGSALSQSVGGVVTLIPASPSVSTSHPALIGFATPKTSAELSYRQLFGLGELEDFAAHLSHKHRRLGGALSMSRFGQAGLYQEYTVSAASSFQIRSDVAVGAALLYRSAEFGENQSRYAGAELAISAAYRPMPSILISAATRRLMADQVYDDIDTDPVYEASLAWTSPSEVSLGAIWTRERQGDHRFALGQILNLTQNLDFLAGLRFAPVRYTLGGRALYRGMSLVYAYEGHSELGATHSFGLSWSPNP